MKTLFWTIIFMFVFKTLPVNALSDVTDQIYFDFMLPSNLFMDGQETNVKFIHDIKSVDIKTQKRLTVRPVLSAGAVEILNESASRYVGLADLNSTAPYLREEMTLKFTGIQSSEVPVSLKFIILDIYAGKGYVTPTKRVWGSAYYKKYTDLLNENLLKSLPDAQNITLDDPESGSVSTKPGDPVKLYLWYLSPAFFLFGLLKSPHGYG